MHNAGEALDDEPPRSVLARGLRLLDAFGSSDTELTLAELAARTRLPKATAYRLLRELRAWGGVEQTPTGGYRLGIHLFTLAQRARWQWELRHGAFPYLEDLYEATHENVSEAARGPGRIRDRGRAGRTWPVTRRSSSSRWRRAPRR